MTSPASTWDALPPLRTSARHISSRVAQRRARFGAMLPTRSTFPHRYATPGDLGRRLIEAPAGIGAPRTIGFGVFNGFTQGSAASTWSSRFGFSPNRRPSTPAQPLTSLPPRSTPPTPPPAQRATPRPTPTPRAASTPAGTRGAPAQRRRIARVDEPGEATADPDAAAAPTTPTPQDGLPDLLADARAARPTARAPRTTPPANTTLRQPSRPAVSGSPTPASAAQRLTSPSSPTDAARPPASASPAAADAAPDEAPASTSTPSAPDVEAPLGPRPTPRATDGRPPASPNRPGVLGRLLPRRGTPRATPPIGQPPRSAEGAPSPANPQAERLAQADAEAAQRIAASSTTLGPITPDASPPAPDRPTASDDSGAAARPATPNTPASPREALPTLEARTLEAAATPSESSAPTTSSEVPRPNPPSTHDERGDTPLTQLATSARADDAAAPTAQRLARETVGDASARIEATIDGDAAALDLTADETPTPGAGYTPRSDTPMPGALGRTLLGSLRSAALAGNRWTYRTVSMNALGNARVRGEGAFGATGAGSSTSSPTQRRTAPAATPAQRLATRSTEASRPTNTSTAGGAAAAASNTPAQRTTDLAREASGSTPAAARTANLGAPRAAAQHLVARRDSTTTTEATASDAAARPVQRMAGEVGRRAATDASSPRATYSPLAAQVRARVRLAGNLAGAAAPTPALARASAITPATAGVEATAASITTASIGSTAARGVTAQRSTAVQRRALSLRGGTATSSASDNPHETRAPGALASRSLELARRIGVRASTDVVSIGGTASAPVAAASGAAPAASSRSATTSPAQRSARASTGTRASARTASEATPGSPTPTAVAQGRATGARTATAALTGPAVPVRPAANLGLTRAIEGGSVLAGHAAARTVTVEARGSTGRAALSGRSAVATSAVQRLAARSTTAGAEAARRATGEVSLTTADAGAVGASPSPRVSTRSVTREAGDLARAAEATASPSQPSERPAADDTRATAASPTEAPSRTPGTPPAAEVRSAPLDAAQRLAGDDTPAVQREHDVTSPAIARRDSLIPADASMLSRALGDTTTFAPDAIGRAPVRGLTTIEGDSSSAVSRPAAQRRARTTASMNDEIERSASAAHVLGLPRALGSAEVLANHGSRIVGAQPLAGVAQRLARSSATRDEARSIASAPASASAPTSTRTAGIADSARTAASTSTVVSAVETPSTFRAASGAQRFAAAAQRRAASADFAGIDVQGMPVAARAVSVDTGSSSTPAARSTSAATPTNDRTIASAGAEGDATDATNTSGASISPAAQRLARRHGSPSRPGHVGRRGLATADRGDTAFDGALETSESSRLGRTAASSAVPGVLARRALPSAVAVGTRQFEGSTIGSMAVGGIGGAGLGATSTGSRGSASATQVAAASARTASRGTVAQRVARGDRGAASSSPATRSSTDREATAGSRGDIAPARSSDTARGTSDARPAQRRTRRAGDSGRALQVAHLEGAASAGVSRVPGGAADFARPLRAVNAGSLGIASMQAVQRLARRGTLGAAQRWTAPGHLSQTSTFDVAGDGSRVAGSTSSLAGFRPGEAGRRALPRLSAARTVEVDGAQAAMTSAALNGPAAVAAALGQQTRSGGDTSTASAGSGSDSVAAQRTSRRGSSRARRASARATLQPSGASSEVTPAQRSAPATSESPRRERSGSTRAAGERGHLDAAALALPRAFAPQRTVSGLTQRVTPAVAGTPGRPSVAGRETQEAVTAVSALAAAVRGTSGATGRADAPSRSNGGGDTLSASDAIQRLRRSSSAAADNTTRISSDSGSSDTDRSGSPAAARILGRRGGQTGEVAGLPVGGPGATVAAARTVAADIVQRAISSISFQSHGPADAPGGPQPSGGGVSTGGSPSMSHGGHGGGAPLGGSSGVSANAAPSPVQRIVGEDGRVPERGLSEQQVAAILQVLEDRVLAMIERRGGRYRGTF